MSRPHRHTPKRQDPDFLVMHQSSRNAEHVQVDTVEITKASDAAKLSVSDGSVEVTVSEVADNVIASSESELPSQSSSLGEGSKSVVAKTERKKRKSVGTRRANSDDDFENATIHIRKCEKAGCPAKRPVCFVGLSEKCAKNGYTSRWYHISPGEHFCNECFDHCYRTNHCGHGLYRQWKERWDAGAQGDGGLKRFMVDLFLPYWLACSRCGRWRQVPRDVDITTEYMQTFWCGTTYGSKKVHVDPNACNVEHDERATQALDPNWLRSVTVAPLILQSPAVPFLIGYRYADTVGHSPSAAYDSGSSTLAVSQPFCNAGEPMAAGMVIPDLLTEEECCRMINYSSDVNLHACYLAVRNAIIAQWHLNCKERVTVESVACRLLCRGLIRLRYISDLPYIIYYLTCKGLINTGYLPSPTDDVISAESSIDENSWDAIVIGAGIAGLAAARHMRNACGLKVLVLEARSRAGGRMQYSSGRESSFETVGGLLLNGINNNPVAMLCKQCNIPLRVMEDNCPLISEETGRVISADADQRVEFHISYLLDSVDDWRKNDDGGTDVSLLEKITQIHQQFTQESRSTFSAEEEAVLQFHLAQLEFACGGALAAISARQWDHNEDFPQYDGPPCMLIASDCERLISCLSTDVRLEFSADVTSVNYGGDSVTVTIGDGRTFVGDYVVVTVPLGVLKTNSIDFRPPLPPSKQDAIHQLGAGHVEQVILHFSKRFWHAVAGGYLGCFGRVASQADCRARFSVFYDLTSPASDDGACETSSPKFTLMTFLCGDSVNCNADDKYDAEAIVADCLSVLRRLFPKEEVPEPLAWHVSDWKHDQYSRMAFSYMPVGCSGAAYSSIASSVDNKLFFAGEATNQSLPQSITGAYTSGLHAAKEILMLSTFD